MQTLVRQAKPRVAADAGKVVIFDGTTKVTYYLPKKKALGLTKQSVLQIGTPGLQGPKTTRLSFGDNMAKRHLHKGIGVKLARSAHEFLTSETAEQIAYVQSLKDAEGGAWTSAEFEQITGLSREALRQRRNVFTIVYWTDVRGHCSYPKWQFDANMQVIKEVREILGLLKTHDTMHVLRTFLVPSIGDAGESVLQLIRSGRGSLAVEHVHTIVNEH